MGGMQLSCILWPGSLVRIIVRGCYFIYLFINVCALLICLYDSYKEKKYLLADSYLCCFGTVAGSADA